jgi:hypothetical protein
MDHTAQVGARFVGEGLVPSRPGAHEGLPYVGGRGASIPAMAHLGCSKHIRRAGAKEIRSSRSSTLPETPHRGRLYDRERLVWWAIRDSVEQELDPPRDAPPGTSLRSGSLGAGRPAYPRKGLFRRTVGPLFRLTRLELHVILGLTSGLKWMPI